MEKDITQENAEILSPDINRLDEEWVVQPALYHTWAVKLAKARRNLDRAEAELKLTKATVGKDIRKDPDSYGVDKVTETSVADAVLISKKVQEIQNRVIEYQFRVNVLLAMVTALDHRKRALEDLVTLQGRDYFSTPSADKNNRERMSEVVKKAVRRKCQRNDK